eukprot:scaffold4619_cov146-Skeletonema_menzelii.AAC.2
MKYHLPHYYYLSPSQLQHLSFRVNISIRRNSGAIQSKELRWREISYEDNTNELETDLVTIYTLTTEEGGLTMLEDDIKRQGRNALASRIHRDGEDPSSTMKIMARVGHHVEELCVLKMYNKHAILSASPALSEKGEDEMHSFSTPDLGNIDYTIEMMVEQALDEGDCTLNLKRNRISEEKRRQLRQLSWKEVDDAEYVFDYQTHVEIVSANGFTQPNILFSAPFGSTLIIRYKILKPNLQDVVLKGSTNKLQSYDAFSTSIKFCASFFVAFICIGFVSHIYFFLVQLYHQPYCSKLLSFLNVQTILNSLGMSIEGEAVPAVLLAIILLGLLCQFIVFGRTRIHHINHQFSILFRESSDDHPTTFSQQNAMLEMNAYFHHNFGMISLAGSAVTPLPFEPGTYDINVPTFKPIACSGLNERKCRMQSYYLGTCLSEVQPSEPPSTEDDLAIGLLSKAGLKTDGSGTIHLRVNVMKNYFNGAYSKGILDDQESSQHRMKVQETVDEVLSRVRRNKRVRMSRPSSFYPTDRNVARRSVRRSKVALSNEEKAEGKDDDEEEEETKQSDLATNFNYQELTDLFSEDDRL